MAAIPIEQRLRSLETEMTLLKERLAKHEQQGLPWWKQIRGAFAGDPAFEEAMRLGRRYRESFRAKPSAKKRQGR